ncbi:hypothetical protein Drose_09580 [Dactylosporangium roseum]|uniref:Fibronectin type-III domain-containing protein n=1 Tax=Dactylosporangium roseum TaxID=47989 RepID=A0ABY5Z9C2_9ACTN|nr:hypothetical protein [Dactylosporangium roseum]UWZ38462.1 hypothetical protein Drose_09580 [Dactylosporangium roseum]
MKRRIGTAFVIAAAVLAGVAGCGVLPGLGGSPGSSGPSGSLGSGKVLDLPQRTVYSKGDTVDPSAGITTGPPVRGPIASISPLPTVTPARPTPSLSPTECTGMLRQGVINGLDVTPGTTSATVTWWNIGDPAITEYRLTAVSQELYRGVQPGWTWQSVPPGKGCTRVSATVTGLSSQVPYVFVLHALLKKYETLPPIAPEVARSESVRML